jgi:O-antigen/teichoic acid export membrane protein
MLSAVSEKKRVARGITMNWLAFGFSSGVAFFLSPFVVHRLGNITYGVWALVVSLISYMGLLDLGLRGAVVRYVSHHRAQGGHEEASRIASAALWLRFCISFLAILIGLFFARFTPQYFHIPGELQSAARLAIAVAACSFGVTLLGGVFGGILAAFHRFDLLSAVSITQTAARALGVVWILEKGHGIVALACWEFVVVLAANLSLVALAFRTYPQLRIVPKKPDEKTLKAIWGFSAYIFIIQVCVQVMYYTDNVVVGVCVSAAAITFYSIGGTLIEYIRQMIASLVTTFLPLASKLEAGGQRSELQNLLIKGTNAALAVSLPFEVVLLFRGPTFIGLWMGSQYATVSGHVLQILLLGHILSVTTHTSANIAYGIGKPKPIVLWRVGEAIVNFVLSILLARRIGITGVAWGTAIPSLFISLFFFPRFMSKLMGLPLGDYFRKGWAPAFLAAAPFAITCIVTDRYWHPTTLLHFIGQVAIIFPIYLIGVLLFFGRDVLEFLQSQEMLPGWLPRYLPASQLEKDKVKTAG